MEIHGSMEKTVLKSKKEIIVVLCHYGSASRLDLARFLIMAWISQEGIGTVLSEFGQSFWEVDAVGAQTLGCL